MNRKKQKEEKIKLIKMTALKLFVKNGYHNTTTSSIAKEAGISEGLIFHYFSNKQAIYDNLVASGFKTPIKFINKNKLENPLEHMIEITATLLKLIELNKEISYMFVFMNRARHNDDLSEETKELMKQYDIINQTSKIIEIGQGMGQFRDGEPLSLSLTFWSFFSGLSEEIVFDPSLPLPKPQWILDCIVKGESNEE